MASCARQVDKPGVRRLAILPANVLIADPSSEWMRLAVPIVLTQDLASARNLVPEIVPDQGDVYATQASETLRFTIEQRDRTYYLDSALLSLATLRNVYTGSQHTSDANLIRALDTFAHTLDSHASSFGTQNLAALQPFAAALFSNNIHNKIAKLQEAISADHSFGLAYSVLVETLAGVKSPELQGTVARADAARAGFSEIDRARYEFVRSRVMNASLEKQASAGIALTSLLPNDSEASASTAAILFLLAKPTDASRLMERALMSNPGNAALQQQFGLGLLENRQFAEAEKHFRAIGLQPALLPALAFCVFFEGDHARAASIYESYLKSIPSTDAKTLLRTSWQAHVGDLDGAIASLVNAQFQDPHLAAVAKTQLVIFYLLKGDRDGARKAGQSAGPIASLLGNGAASAEQWRSRVGSLPAAVANDDVKRTLLANGYFLYGFYGQAAEAWREADRAVGNTDLRVRAMLAASLAKAGQTSEARAILVQPFVPDLNDLFSVVSFSELRKRLGQAG